MAASKKDIELWRLERFKSFIADLPDGRLEPTEEPDFLVHCEHRVIGIELTELHRGTRPGQVPQQASEAMRNRVVARAKELYDARNQPPVLVSFFLDDRVHIKKSEVEQLATALADLVSGNIPEVNSSAEVPANWQDYRKLPSILHKVLVRRLDVVTKTFFGAPGATWVSSLSREEIMRAVASKEPKLSAYRTRCDEAWLVINADMESMATWFDFDSAPLQERFATAFDRVFVVRHFGGKAIELGIARPVTPNPSFEARPKGKPPGPAPGEVYHPSIGPSGLPSAPPQLQR